MRIAYVGRFAPGWATERDMATALRRAGHEVLELGEDDPATWAMLADPVARRPLELVVWTPALLRFDRPQHEAMAAIAGAVPVVGYHLDRWWGLRRQRDLTGSAFLACALIITADGGHDAEWERAGVRHAWLPPAIAAEEAGLEGRPRDELAADVAFVGSWRRYHPEWPHRRQLVEHLREWFGKHFVLVPDHQGPLRGQALSDLYASVGIVVGDSCLAGGGRYWSDRVPETLGRGGFLLHPEVEGMGTHFKAGEHLATWPAGDWKALHKALGFWMVADGERRRIRQAGRAEVLEHHTYDVRARQLLELAAAEGLV